jgi:hypothetical protein
MSLAPERGVFDQILDSKSDGVSWPGPATVQYRGLGSWPPVGHKCEGCPAVIYLRLLRRYARGVMPTSRRNVRVKCAPWEKPTVSATSVIVRSLSSKSFRAW